MATPADNDPADELLPEDEAFGREPAAGGDLLAELEKARRERDEYLGHWQRAQADYKNLKRRTRADVEAMQRGLIAPLLDRLLLVLDNLDLALSAPAEHPEARALAEGVAMTRAQLLAALAEEDVAPICSEGQFDPALHQAVESVRAEGVEPGTIVETVRPGYTWRGSVLRYAQVKVAAEEGDAEQAGLGRSAAEADTDLALDRESRSR